MGGPCHENIRKVAAIEMDTIAYYFISYTNMDIIKIIIITMSMTRILIQLHISWHGLTIDVIKRLYGLTSPPLIKSFKGYNEIHAHGRNFSNTKSTKSKKLGVIKYCDYHLHKGNLNVSMPVDKNFSLFWHLINRLSIRNLIHSALT